LIVTTLFAGAGAAGGGVGGGGVAGGGVAVVGVGATGLPPSVEPEQPHALRLNATIEHAKMTRMTFLSTFDVSDVYECRHPRGDARSSVDESSRLATVSICPTCGHVRIFPAA
jgi:hypothetical protein